MLNHIAIIMDGNDRWSAGKGLHTSDGHRAGAENAMKIIRATIEMNIQHLSLFAFSSENFSRPKDEVANFTNLLEEYAISELEKMHEYKIKVHFVGDIEKFGQKTANQLRSVEDLSSQNKELNLYVLVNYGSRKELTYAFTKMLQTNIDPQDVNEEMLREYFYCPSMPDVDLLIRTGNQTRISNFLLWQSAYAELYFSKKLWPDFSSEDLQEALTEYSKRKRTFGLRDAK